MNGRPLRFLGVTLGAWVTFRAAMLWPVAAPLPALIRAVAPPAAAAPVRTGRARPVPAASPPPAGPAAVPALTVDRQAPSAAAAGSAPVALAPVAPAVQALPSNTSDEDRRVEPVLPPPLPLTPTAPGSRFTGSVWVVARAAGDDRAVPGAQLGGSQAGVRLGYALGARRRLALAGRVSTPLEGRGREAALGVEWRPVDAPVRLVAEQRWSLDGGRGGPTLMAVAGLPPTRAGPLVAEAYAQAGAIARGRVDGFADAAGRLAVPVKAGPRGLRLDLGVGAWGGAQPGAARLDLGPSVALGVPVGGRRVRLTLDWRERVAGRARPGSGPALSIGSDF